jgi:hypothetical protein
MGETGDDGLDKNPCAVGRCVDHKALIIVITWILPLGLDSYSVTNTKRLVIVRGNWKEHEARVF